MKYPFWQLVYQRSISAGCSLGNRDQRILQPGTKQNSVAKFACFLSEPCPFIIILQVCYGILLLLQFVMKTLHLWLIHNDRKMNSWPRKGILIAIIIIVIVNL